MAIAEGSQGTESGTGGKHLVKVLKKGNGEKDLGSDSLSSMAGIWWGRRSITNSSSVDDGDGDGRRTIRAFVKK